ncbi:MAG TPA: hypothetical protein VGB73_01335 [Pyrinomonadaceae bacterium]|jgi:hypothetical protein
MIETFTKETFASRLNTTFRVRLDAENTLDLELVEATGDDDAGEQPRRQIHFSAIFRSPPDKFLMQRSYRMEHDDLGEFDLFIVPIAKDEKGFYYEAVFNRIVR